MFYIFHGDDTHAQRETLQKLIEQPGDRAVVDLNTTRLAGNGLDVATLRQACATVPFLSPIRLVIVEDLLTGSPGKETIDALVDYLPQLPATTRLVFLESKSLPARSRLLQLAEKAENGYVKAFNLPEGQALDRWIRQRVSERGGRIESQAVQLLASSVGNNLNLMENEIEKLVLYKGTGESITTEDVERLCPTVAEASIFDLVDALGNRDGRQAALLLQKKTNEGSDPFYLFAMFVRQFRLLIQVKELADADQRPPAIARKLSLHPFVAGKLYQQSQRFSLSQLEQIYAHLLEIDVGVKTGRTDMPAALDLLVVGLSMT